MPNDTDIESILANTNGLDLSSILSGGLGSGNLVWYGYGPTQNVRGGDLTRRLDQTKSLNDAKQEINDWPYSKLQQFARSLYAQGKIPAPVVNIKQLQAVWEEMVTHSAAFYNGGKGQRISPWDVLARYMEGDSTGGAQTGPRTATNLFDPGVASENIDQLLQQRLGRGATEGEKKAFVSALNAAMTANPQVTTTDAQGNTVNQQGTDAGAFAQDYVRKNFGGEVGTYQAATTYFNALEQLLGGPSAGSAE